MPPSLSLSLSQPPAPLAQRTPTQEYRDFKGANGKVIQAVLIDKTDTEAVLLLRNGQRANVPLDKLGAEDQAYIKAWNKEKAVFLQKCRGLTIRQCLELRGYESFPFRFENNSIFVDGKINGKPARLLIDTGAGTSLLHAPYADLRRPRSRPDGRENLRRRRRGPRRLDSGAHHPARRGGLQGPADSRDRPAQGQARRARNPARTRSSARSS